jgi:hypothetical protein
VSDACRHGGVVEGQLAVRIEARVHHGVDGWQVGAGDLIAALDHRRGEVLLGGQIAELTECTAARIMSSLKATTTGAERVVRPQLHASPVGVLFLVVGGFRPLQQTD